MSNARRLAFSIVSHFASELERGAVTGDSAESLEGLFFHFSVLKCYVLLLIRKQNMPWKWSSKDNSQNRKTSWLSAELKSARIRNHTTRKSCSFITIIVNVMIPKADQII